MLTETGDDRGLNRQKSSNIAVVVCTTAREEEKRKACYLSLHRVVAVERCNMTVIRNNKITETENIAEFDWMWRLWCQRQGRALNENVKILANNVTPVHGSRRRRRTVCRVFLSSQTVRSNDTPYAFESQSVSVDNLLEQNCVKGMDNLV